MRRFAIAVPLVASSLAAMTVLTGPAVASGPAHPAVSAVTSAPTPGSVIATIATGTKPTDVAMDTQKALLYVLDAGTPRVVVVSTTSNTVISTIVVPENATYLTPDPKRSQIFVTSGDASVGTGSLSVIDTRTGTVTGTTPLRGDPRRPVLDADRAVLYIAQAAEGDRPGTLTTIDAASHAVLANVTLGVSPGTPELDAAGSRLYIPQNTTVAVYDTHSTKRIANVKVGEFPDFVVLDPTHHQYFAVKLDALIAIDSRTNKVKATLRMPIAIDDGPPALDAGRQRMYIPSWPYRGRITVLDTRTLKVKARITVGLAPGGPVLDPIRRQLYVREFDEGNGHTLYAIDTAKNTVIGAIGVGKGPLAPVLDAASGRLYVPSWATGEISVVNTAALAPR